jgi:hypothetical protein
MRTDKRSPETATASEIADFVFCPEAWRLAELGCQSANQTERDRGTTHHTHKATAERVAGGSIAIGRVLSLVALLALALLWAVTR